MLIFIDSRAPEKAKRELGKTGEVIDFETSGICYDAISGHPDVFFFQHPSGLIIAPNTPKKYKDILIKNGIEFSEGKLPVGKAYPDTAHYNALFTTDGIIHNRNISDPTIKKLIAKSLHCKQGYVRCTTIQIGDVFLTSDPGIEYLLTNQSLNVCYLNPQSIVLDGFRNGFIGGCCGIWQKNIFICGSLHSIPNKDYITTYIHSEGYSIVELTEGPLIDVGGIFFFHSK
jgi:hypothetical protein